MKILLENHIKNSAVIFLTALFFSCGNTTKEVQDFLAEKNLPIGEAKNVYLIHTDSGRVQTKLIAPVLNDFANRENHPYQEFPKGIEITTYTKENDSITLTADYATTFSKTGISEVNGNVVVTNYKEKSKLLTEQLFWDQKTHYIYTEKPFKLYTQTDSLKGKGFESKEDLSKVVMKDFSGILYLSENANSEEL
ncbi:MAG: LPS export ABC transporter periplasmic protein LptC [Flavobacteriales bacterium]|nr:MAG: LPS export ABC transporter periplasmic protein LptC [Flavobacteriales bacterium]